MKSIPWFSECYTIDEQWIVYNSWIPMKWSIAKWRAKLFNRYKKVRIDGKVWSVNRLMYISFIWPIPEWYVIDHINEKKRDNRIENLQCISPQENTRRSRLLKRIQDRMDYRNETYIIYSDKYRI